MQVSLKVIKHKCYVSEYSTHLERLNTATSFLPNSLPALNPSENRMTSAICSLSGLDMATGRNNCFKLSGNFCRPP